MTALVESQGPVEPAGFIPVDAEQDPPEPATEDRSGDLEDADFAMVLLHALTRMAERSKRRQADVTAAVRGADLPIDLPRIRSALRLLCALGAIENLVPLSDGGLLLSVTQQVVDRRGLAPEWLPLDQLDGSAS